MSPFLSSSPKGVHETVNSSGFSDTLSTDTGSGAFDGADKIEQREIHVQNV